MRIIQIGGFHIGAQKTVEEAIHRYLKKQRNDSYLFYAYGKSMESGSYCYTNLIESLITRVFRRILGKKDSFAILQTIRLIIKLYRLKPELIHLHVIHDGYVYYKLLFWFIVHEHIPVVYTMHDLWAFTGGCYHYTCLRCDGYKTGCYSCPAKKEQLDCEKSSITKSYETKKFFFERTSQYASVAVSQWVSRQINMSFLYNKPAFVIYNCIEQPDLDKIKAYNSPKRNSVHRLVGIANTWDVTKGIDKMYCIANYLGSEYEILLVGNIDESIKKNAPPNIIFFGYSNIKEQIYSLLSEADLYISTSLEETLGLTFVEAAYVGTKSIGFDSTAIKEILTIVDGICVKDLSITTMCEEIKNVLANGSNKLSKDKVNRVKHFFSDERMTYEYSRVYESVLNQKV